MDIDTSGLPRWREKRLLKDIADSYKILNDQKKIEIEKLEKIIWIKENPDKWCTICEIEIKCKKSHIRTKAHKNKI